MIAGRELIVETGQLAQLANGSALIRYGDTSVLVTATASKTPREGIDFFPLSCDYEERLYAVGKIPGGFIKREGRPTEKAVLSSRLMDRPIRPLFPKGYRNDVQVVATVLSVDQDHVPEIVAMVGSSVALSISDIPFNGPTGSVSMGLVDGELVINPTSAQREKSELDLVVSGTKDAIMMVEAGANEVPEDVILSAILAAHEEIKILVDFQEEIIQAVGKEKMQVELLSQMKKLQLKLGVWFPKTKDAIQTIDKLEREDNIDTVKEQILEKFRKDPDEQETIEEVIASIEKDEVRKMITIDGVRPITGN